MSTMYFIIIMIDIHEFKMQIYLNGFVIFTIYYIDTTGKYSGLNKLKFEDTIVLKDIFTHDEDYEHHIHQITVFDFENYYIDFSDYNFISLKKFTISNIRCGFNKILNLDTSLVKKLHIYNCTINDDFMNFIKKFMKLEYLVFIDNNLIKKNIDIRDIINNMKNLQKLYIINYNNEIIINDDSFYGFDKLFRLRLIRCNVASLKPFEKIPNLEELYITNDVIEIQKSSFEKFARYILYNPSLIEFSYGNFKPRI